MRPVLASRKNAAIYAHWVNACGGGEMPKRLDLQIGGWEVEWRKNLLQVMKMMLPVVDQSTITTETGLKLDTEHLALPLSEDGVSVDRVLGAIDFYKLSPDKLAAALPALDWKAISNIEMEKRIIIFNLRIQL